MADEVARLVANGSLKLTLAELKILILMLVAGLAWGLKIEYDASQLAAQFVEHVKENARAVGEINGQLAQGILPRADERIRAVEARLAVIERRMDAIEREHARMTREGR